MKQGILTKGKLGRIIRAEKEASGLRLLSRLHGVQKVGSSNLPAPTLASTEALATFLVLVVLSMM